MKQSDRIQGYLNRLRETVAGELRTDRYSRVLYSTDASIYQVMPYGVLLPKTVEDVQAAVELAAECRVPILPRASGSSLAGQAVNEALVIDVARHLDGILEVNAEEHWVRVQPGVVLDELNLYLQAWGLQFGPDPASSNRAAMGGVVSNNSTGAHSILYGMTADHVLETKVVLSDGSWVSFGPLEHAEVQERSRRGGLEGDIYRRVAELARANGDVIRAGTPHHWRRCGGYNLDRFVHGPSFKAPQDSRFNLAKLVCGAEGTLAVITEVKLNLVPRPAHAALAILHYDSLYEALLSVPIILAVDPSAVELVDNLGLTLCRDVPSYSRLLDTFVQGAPDCILITEFYGESQEGVKAKIERLRTHLRNEKVACSVVPAFERERQANVWKVRKVALGLMMSIKGDHKPIPFIEDAAVPPQHLAEYVTRIKEFCNELGTSVAYYAHASAGCIHIRPLINAKIAGEVAKLPEITSFSVELLGQYGGSLSSEHGDGRARSWMNERFFGKGLYGLFREVKQTFDPENILNPGNIVDAGPMTENLRYGADYDVIPVEEQIDFSGDMGFHRAVEMCNGAGVCRKKTIDTMCPSYMVTREEEHSTRGRANALRAALSGGLPAEELTSRRMYQVMDLCIECKACKAECPSSVDMAKIKFEFLAQYYKRHPVPIRTRFFADIARWSRLASGPWAPILNWSVKNGWVRWGLERFLGIARQRQLPEFARQPFTHWFERRAANRPPLADKQIVLFNDTFNTYNHPQVCIAATQVLEAAGYQVVLPGHRCCGRPMISKGLVDQARDAARDTVNRLAPFAEQGVPIVGLEPSCLLTMRDEYASLLPGDPRVQQVADHCYTFEEFFAKLADEGELRLEFTDEKRQLLLHGHCHQKSLVGTAPSKRALTLPSGYSVTEVDSGCCGMAGAFGYEAEHYEISMAMAERRLLPAVRELSGDAIIVAAGVSCRQQIEHGTGRKAYHPAEVLQRAIRF